MKALVYNKPYEFEYRDVPNPIPGEGELLVRVKAVGICGSDVHGMTGKTGRRIPPLIMGHEASGIVEEVVPGKGGSAHDFKKGDPITFDSTIYCNRCPECLQGRVNLCRNRMVLGVACDEYHRDGAMAEYVTVPPHISYRIPEGMPFEKAAMVEPVSIAFHAVRRAAPGIGTRALVIGCGIIGQCTIQAAKIAGCGTIVASDIDAARLAMAHKLGADFVVDSSGESWRDEALAHTEGKGFDVVFEAVGLEVTVRSALDVVRKGGKVVQVGNVTPNVSVPLQRIVSGEIDFLGSCASAGEYPACLEMIAGGRMNLDPLISKVASLSEGADWFHALHEQGANAAKGEAGAKNTPLFKVILEP